MIFTSAKPPTPREVRRRLNTTPPKLDQPFAVMADADTFDGVVANVGAASLGEPSHYLG